jgi:hypothetical protein
MKHINQDIPSSGRDKSSGPPEYEAGILTLRLRRSTFCKGNDQINFTAIQNKKRFIPVNFDESYTAS